MKKQAAEVVRDRIIDDAIDASERIAKRWLSLLTGRGVRFGVGLHDRPPNRRVVQGLRAVGDLDPRWFRPDHVAGWSLEDFGAESRLSTR